MFLLRLLAIIGSVWPSISLASTFDVLILDCRIELAVDFDVEAREGMGSKVSFRYFQDDEFDLTTISVSKEGEWVSNNPLEQRPYQVLSQQEIGELQHMVIRTDLKGYSALELDLITDGSTYVEILGVDREAIVNQFIECPEI